MTPDHTTPDDEQDWAQEADRLRRLDADTQRQVIERVRAPSKDRRVPKADRELARRRADYLERALGAVTTPPAVPPTAG